MSACTNLIPSLETVRIAVEAGWVLAMIRDFLKIDERFDFFDFLAVTPMGIQG